MWPVPRWDVNVDGPGAMATLARVTDPLRCKWVCPGRRKHRPCGAMPIGLAIPCVVSTWTLQSKRTCPYVLPLKQGGAWGGACPDACPLWGGTPP